jgi:hypothetical protein
LIADNIYSKENQSKIGKMASFPEETPSGNTASLKLNLDKKE